MRDFISILDFSRSELESIFEEADRMREINCSDILEGRIMALAFFEPSTRARLGFSAAMFKLGGGVIELGGPEKSAMSRGENFSDTIKVLDGIADVIVIRHGLEGASKLAAQIAESPVINAGDGSREYPVQGILDLYAIKSFLGRIDGLHIGIIGDLRYGRSVRSFILGLTRFLPAKLYLMSPESLKIKEDIREALNISRIDFEEISWLEEVISELDVLYVTRLQKERFPDISEYEKLKGTYRIEKSLLKEAKERMIILHPLPRTDELSPEVDETPHAKYFKQAALYVPVAMAILRAAML
ncbi:MAG: aspartate carbamoyltransferase [Thermoproteota archaeon]|nr:MAG: aspartate carbamoyltransferase [Candidatus Korarchaeota archaeon]